MFVNRPLTTRAVVFIGLLGALSFLLMSFEFPLPFAPAYMKFEISDMPALFGGFFLGPIAGALAAFVKILLKLVIIGTNSALVGEVMNLFCSIAYVVPSTIFYHLHHSKKGALYALVSGSLIASIFAVVTNYYFAIPMYVKLYGIPLETILKMGRAVNPFVDSPHRLSLILRSCPFNLIKYGIVSFLTYLVYKKASVALTEIVNRLDR